MEKIKAIVFDLGGTVFDWETTVRDRIQQLTVEQNQAIDSSAFANDWGEELFRVHAKVRRGDLPWMNFDDMHVIALDTLKNQYPVLNSIENPMELVRATWHRLNAQPGAAEGIDRLRTKFTVVTLTNLTWASVVNSSKLANIQWDGILSCEFLGFYKPSRQAYLRGARSLGLEPAECLKVSYDGIDLEAAQSAGLATAQIMSGATDIDMKGFGSSINTFDILAEDSLGLCDKLGA